MRGWHPRRVRQFRGQVLTYLCGVHNGQQHRTSDTELTRGLQGIAIQCSIYDVVTILQDMKDRDWVKFRSMYNEISDRTELSQIEIRPMGRDLCEQTTTHDAVEFW